MLNKNKPDLPLSSNALVFKKYKKIEIGIVIAIIVSGIIASILLPLERENPVGDTNNLIRVFIGIMAGVIIILLVFFIIYYLKIRKLLKERDEND